MPKTRDVIVTITATYTSLADAMEHAQEVYDRINEQGEVITFETEVIDPQKINLLDHVN